MADSITERVIWSPSAAYSIWIMSTTSQPGLPWPLMANLQELFHCDYVERRPDPDGRAAVRA